MWGGAIYLYKHTSLSVYLSLSFSPHVHTHTHTYISLSSCRATSTDIPDPLSPLLPIVHRLRQVFRATSRILTELLYVCSSWSSRFCSAICGGPLEYITYELVPASPAVSSCLVRLTWIVFVMGGRWPYSWCLVGCCRQDLFNIARNILV